ncbi:MAG: GNAT family N-acetyltransferase [Deltaproteobacteria bacterium]|nr:GNAT family N-acetyltransferase [Deltaproteobacteria bacterium]
MEKDGYDSVAHPIGIFDRENKLIGCVRLISAPQPFMIEKEFACLLPQDEPFRKPLNMAEVTRICIKKEYRTILLGSSLTLGHLIYKAIYQWCLMEDTRFLAAVVEKNTTAL